MVFFFFSLFVVCLEHNNSFPISKERERVGWNLSAVEPIPFFFSATSNSIILLLSGAPHLAFFLLFRTDHSLSITTSRFLWIVFRYFSGESIEEGRPLYLQFIWESRFIAVQSLARKEYRLKKRAEIPSLQSPVWHDRRTRNGHFQTIFAALWCQAMVTLHPSKDCNLRHGRELEEKASSRMDWKAAVKQMRWWEQSKTSCFLFLHGIPIRAINTSWPHPALGLNN